MSQKKDVSVYYCGFCEMTHTLLKKGATCPTCGRRYCLESIETSKEVGRTKCPFCHIDFDKFPELLTISPKKHDLSSTDPVARIEKIELKYFRSGHDLCESGRYSEALAAFNKAIEIYPDYAVAWNNKGIVLEYLGQYNEAILAYEKAMKIKPDYTEARFNNEALLRKLSKSRCFIATAAYGTPLHPELDILRGFRDNWLIRRPWGRKLVSTYYITSPQIALRVEQNLYLKKAIRFWISLIVKLLKRLLRVIDSSISKTSKKRLID